MPDHRNADGRPRRTVGHPLETSMAWSNRIRSTPISIASWAQRRVDQVTAGSRHGRQEQCLCKLEARFILERAAGCHSQLVGGWKEFGVAADGSLEQGAWVQRALVILRQVFIDGCRDLPQEVLPSASKTACDAIGSGVIPPSL